MSRVYQLKSPGNPGGLLPLAGPPVIVPDAGPPDPMGAALEAVTGIPVRVVGGGGAAAARGVRAEPVKDAHQYPAGTERRLLSKGERTALAILAGQAFAYMLRQDPDWLPDMMAGGRKRKEIEDNWRQGQVKQATTGHRDGAAAGLSKARRSQFRTIQAHFQALMGMDVESLNTSMRTGPAILKAGRDGDRIEDNEQAMKVLQETMGKLKLNLYYVMAVCGGKDGSGGKFHTRNLESLTSRQLWQLIYTLRNRAAERDGRGDSGNRNKAQRAAKKKPAPPVEDNTPF